MGLETSRGAAALLPERKQNCCPCWSRGELGHSGPELLCSLLQDLLRWYLVPPWYLGPPSGHGESWRGLQCLLAPSQAGQ